MLNGLGMMSPTPEGSQPVFRCMVCCTVVPAHHGAFPLNSFMYSRSTQALM